METKELMIGDWVYFADFDYGDIPAKVEGITQFGEIFVKNENNSRAIDAGENDLSPIPITKEILKKNGFSKIGTIGDSYIHCIATDICYCEIEINLHDNTLCINNTWFKANNINYVHELQHALKLCRIEKEIEL